jgi:hypothetical protein
LELSLEDAYIHFNKLINEMNRHNLKRSNIEHNTMFLTNLQPEWRLFTIAIKQNQDLTAKDIKNFFDPLKHNQVEVNDILEQKRKEKETKLSAQLPTQPPVVDPLALVSSYRKNHAFFKHPTNNNLITTSAPTALNKRQDIPPRGEVVRQGVQINDKIDVGQDIQEPKCFGCGQQGHFAKNCPNRKVPNRTYYRQKMLLADMEEKGKILNAEENEFMVDTDDEGEILETNMVYMASLEKVDVFEAHADDSTPSYDTDAKDDDTLGNKVQISDA